MLLLVWFIFMEYSIGKTEECNLNIQIVIPAQIIEGQITSLLCLYDLQNEPLYSVKWYRGNHEFFRYEPKEHPRCKIFSLPDSFQNDLDFNIDISRSNAYKVTFSRIDHRLSGNYSCEVTTDAPHFSSSFATAYVKINSRNINVPSYHRLFPATPIWPPLTNHATAITMYNYTILGILIKVLYF